MTPLERTTVAVSALASLASIYLVYNEVTNPPFCPELLGFPACFAVLFLYATTLVAAFRRGTTSHIVFFTSTGVGLAIAIWFSLQSIGNQAECPLLFSIPIPLCYASFATFLALILLRLRGWKSPRRER